jgi:YegS/Rv2252/BmrU family lipid kinase
MRHVLILNPAAGKGDRVEALAREAKAFFSARGEEAAICMTNGIGHASELARSAAHTGQPTVIYACGGDGTLGEVANGIAGSKTCALATVPIGSGNDFVRQFGDNAKEHFCSIAELADGIVRPIDLLDVDGHGCLNIASAGLDAEICARMPCYKRIPLVSGSMAYYLSLARCFLTSVRNRYAFVVDGEALPAADYLFAVAANGRYYGGGFCAAPQADLSDGLIDLIFVPTIPRIRMIGMIGSYRRGEHLEKYDFMRFLRCKTVQYLADDPISMNLDGEIIPLQNPTVTIRPQALRLMLPRAIL